MQAAALLLAELGGATEPTLQAAEKDDVETLLQLENDMAQAWVQRDTRILERILADDYTLGGIGDFLINREQFLTGVDNPEFRTTSAIVDDFRIRVYGDAAVVTGRAVYRAVTPTRSLEIEGAGVSGIDPVVCDSCQGDIVLG